MESITEYFHNNPIAHVYENYMMSIFAHLVGSAGPFLPALGIEERLEKIFPKLFLDDIDGATFEEWEEQGRLETALEEEREHRINLLLQACIMFDQFLQNSSEEVKEDITNYFLAYRSEGYGDNSRHFALDMRYAVLSGDIPSRISSTFRFGSADENWQERLENILDT